MNDSTIIFDTNEQGSDGWHAVRRGRITASRAKDARDRTAKGGWSAKALGYAYDLARQRVGGAVPEFKGNGYTRAGQENEPVARIKYEGLRSAMVVETGFAFTTDGKFGASPDGLIDDDGVWECKTMVSSATLFTALVTGDISEYRDQCLMGMWLLRRKWVDLTLWCEDLELMRVVRIERDEAEIEALVADLLKFDELVEKIASRMREAIELFRLEGLPPLDMDDVLADEGAQPDAAEPAQQTTKPTKAVAPDAMPELF